VLKVISLSEDKGLFWEEYNLLGIEVRQGITANISPPTSLEVA
jgi:hypothetical protein